MATSPAEPHDRVPAPLRWWRRLPAAVRAFVAGFGVLVVGGGVAGALLYAGLITTPRVPWFLPATVLWLWLVWRWLDGAGWPRISASARHGALRALSLTWRQWAWVLLAGGLALVAVMDVAFVTYRYAALPPAAHRGAIDMQAYPWWTTVAIFAAIALTAGVVEEAAFRGYMLTGLQRRYGWVIAIVVVTVVFYIAHLSHAYATLAFLPFFLLHGLAFGLLVYFTRSIVPGAALHALSDFVVLPMQYGVIASVGRWDFVGDGWLGLVAAVAAVPAFRGLAYATAENRLETPVQATPPLA